MATRDAIAATGQAILRLLEDACPRGEFPQAQFAFLPVSEPAKVIAEGITLSLYRVGVNGARCAPSPRRRTDGRLLRPSLHLDLYFLLTPWASDADKLYRLLGWAMRVLHDTPILPWNLLTAYGPDAGTFHSDETVEIALDPLSLQDLSTLWENYKPKVQLSVTYVARLVVIESETEIVEAREVQTREFDLAKGPPP